MSDSTPQTVKVPINSQEYFLIENRQTNVDTNLNTPYLLADSVTGVILGPVDSLKRLNREYDNLLPGSGILIWHIDEGVAYLDYNNDGFNNFAPLAQAGAPQVQTQAPGYYRMMLGDFDNRRA